VTVPLHERSPFLMTEFELIDNGATGRIYWHKWGAGCVDEHTRVRQNRAAILDDAHASVVCLAGALTGR
jgi:hypothetical protein